MAVAMLIEAIVEIAAMTKILAIMEIMTVVAEAPKIFREGL